ncbi:MAG: glycosyltransferase family 4 protein [Deltaproteobacteria bacterium]|nr:glycosyltransferase family 4 protein [Deltaproteobacteria bacterium]
MRILFLAEAPSPYAREWAEHFASAFGHHVHFASLQAPRDSFRGVTFHPLAGAGARGSGRLGYLAALPAARRLGRSINPDVTIAYRVTSYGVLGALAGLRPLVLAAQGQHIAYPPTSRLKRALARYALRRADLVLAWGAHMAGNMVRLGCERAKIRTIAYGIDTVRYRPDPARRHPGRPPRLLSTRAMRHDYNQELILRAIPDVAKEFPDVRWTAVGEGPDRARLLALGKVLDVAGHLDFPGRVSGEQLLAHLRDCDVYLSAVRTDGVSASLLEAMACGGWPVVIDNEANRLWIRPGENGDLVAPDDPDAMARAIVAALRGTERAAAAREENRALVESRASLTRNMAVIDGMIRALVGGGAARVPPVPADLEVPPPEWRDRAAAGPKAREEGAA